MSWAVVCPTARPAEFERFQKAWGPLFADHEVTVYPVRDEPASWETWPDWVPRRSDMCRSYGFWQAWRDGHEFTLSLDDDVRPIHDDPARLYPSASLRPRDIFAEYEDTFERYWPCVPYLSVGSLTDGGEEMRGFPYENRYARCMVQYGGWDGILDYDGKTQLAGVPEGATFTDHVIPVPRGCAVTTCAMNVAFRTEFTPCMWQLPILEYAPPNKPVLQYPESRPPPAPILVRYNRWGDIWSGLVQKRVLDARGEVMLVNGRASVLHERMSDPQRNAEIEAPGMPLNERLWGGLSQPFEYRSKEITDLFKVFTDKASRYIEPSGAYYHHFLSCRDQWLALFQ